jgi:transcriptional regulator with XRE-family HTH domain
MDKRKEFGKYIQVLRQDRGLTKRQAAMKLGYKGLGTLHSVEQGVAPIPIDKIHPIAKLYKVDAEEILDKLKIYEPELYAKYITPEKDFAEYLVYKIKNFSKSKTAHRLASLSLIIYKMSTKNKPQVLPEIAR